MAIESVLESPFEAVDPEIGRLARELARRTGQNAGDAVKSALRAELTRGGIEERAADNASDIEATLADVARIATGIRESFIAKFGFMPTNSQFDDWMYDENGLPR